MKRSMNPRAAVFPHNGLGDGINLLVLSNILHRNGWRVDTFHNSLAGMQNWFPHLPISPYPPLSDVGKILHQYDWFFVVHNDTDPFVLDLISEGKRRFPDRMRVLYLYASPHIVKEPYYADAFIDPKVSVAENLRIFCKQILHLSKKAEGSVLIPPEELVFRKQMNRVAIHPTTARPSKSWPKEKYVKLALHLKELGFQPVLIPGIREGWKDLEEMGLETAFFPSLDGLARFLFESGYFVGNDSGLGHLASMLDIPTLTICRRKAHSYLWRPSFREGIVVTPPRWIPNIRGLRLRDRYWKEWVSLEKVKKGFQKLSALQR